MSRTAHIPFEMILFAYGSMQSYVVLLVLYAVLRNQEFLLHWLSSLVISACVVCSSAHEVCGSAHEVCGSAQRSCAVTVNFYCRCHGCFQVTVTSSGRKFGFTADFSIGVVSPALYCR